MSKADALRKSRGLAFSMGLAILVLWFVSFYLHSNVRPASTVPNHPLEPIVGLAYTSGSPPVPVSDALTTPFAYVFYATMPQYACSVLVNIDRLQKRFNAKHRIIVLVKPNLDSSYLSAFTAHNATVIPFEPPRDPTEDVPYYQDVLLKLVAFRLHHFIPSLNRILVLDADELILQDLGHVFDLPEVDLAAPRAYWLDDQFSSAFLLISLSDRLWERMESELQAPAIDTFDMGIVNAMFKNTALVLPGDYLTLNSHWETNEIPSWWQGIRVAAFTVHTTGLSGQQRFDEHEYGGMGRTRAKEC